MPQTVSVPGQGEVEFPDSMSDDQIADAIKKTLPPPSPTPASDSATQESAMISAGVDMIAPESLYRPEEHPVAEKVAVDVVEKLSGMIPRSAKDVAGMATPLVGAFDSLVEDARLMKPRYDNAKAQLLGHPLPHPEIAPKTFDQFNQDDWIKFGVNTGIDLLQAAAIRKGIGEVKGGEAIENQRNQASNQGERGPTTPQKEEVTSGLPEWLREEMGRRGISTGRIFNDIDLANPSIVSAIDSDPTLTTVQKTHLKTTGSLPSQGAVATNVPESAATAPFSSPGARVSSTAIWMEGKPYVGSSWNEPHAGVGVRHGFDQVPEDAKGFIVKSPSGEDWFANREEAAQVADSAGQRDSTFKGAPLHSEHLGETTMAQIAPTKEWRDMTDEEMARLEADYRNEMAADYNEHLQSTSHELWSSVMDLGGLPSKLGKGREGLKGEFSNLEDAYRVAYRDPAKRKALDLPNPISVFRRDASHPDTIATGLRDRGFPFETPDDLHAAMTDSLASGRKVFGQGESTTRAMAVKEEPIQPLKLRSGEKQGDLLSTQTEDFKLVGEKGVDNEARQRAKEAKEAALKESDETEQGRLFERAASYGDRPFDQGRYEHLLENLDPEDPKQVAEFEKLDRELRQRALGFVARGAPPPPRPPPPSTMDSGEPPEPPPPPAQARTKGKLLETVSGAMRKIGDFFTVQPVPGLTRAGVSDSAYAHAAARNSVVHTVRDLLSKVFPYDYKNPTVMRVTGDILTKDNILGVYDEAKARLTQLEDGSPEAKAAGRSVRDIEEAHDLDAYEKSVQAAKQDPIIAASIERWKRWVNPEMDKMYAELKNVDPTMEFEPRGRHFQARINLLPLDRAADIAQFTDTSRPMPEPSYSNYRNPNVKRDPFGRRAKGTGQYSTDPGLILTNTIGRRWNEVTKLRFYKDIVDKGHGIINDGETPAVEGLTRLPIKIPETNENGLTRNVERSLWIKKDLAREARDVLNTDVAGPSNPIFRWLTGVQLLSATDLTAHLKNIHTVVANSLGASKGWVDAVRKMPILASADTVGRIAKVTREVMSDSPEVRSEVAQMARQGLIRPQYPATGVQKITRGQQAIHAVDTASRVIMNRFWNNLVERGMAADSITGRRKFVQQIGEYNRRVMGPTMRTMRDIGASPFVVAGRTFNSFSRRLLLGSPGFEAASPKAAAAARAYQISGLVTATTLPAIVNYFTTGQFGGRAGTPIGAIDTGTNDAKGRQKIIDVFQLMGIRRGLRGSGAQAAIEGIREGKSASQIGGKAIDDMSSTMGHPWLGPGLGAMYSTISGKRLDLRGGSWPFIAKRVKEGGLDQYKENLRVTLKNQNPLIYSLLAPLIGETDDTYLEGIKHGFLKSPASGLGVTAVPPGSVFQPQYAKGSTRKAQRSTVPTTPRMKGVPSLR